jgi:hypothetical protein
VKSGRSISKSGRGGLEKSLYERNRSRNRGSLGFWLAGENGEEIALLERDRRERDNGGWDEGILLE